MAQPSVIIFVIDAADVRRFKEVSDEIQKVMDNPDLVGVPLLVLANKQDMVNAIPSIEMELCLNLGSIRDRSWGCIGCSALSGDGLVDALDWTYTGMPNANRQRGASGIFMPGTPTPQQQNAVTTNQSRRRERRSLNAAAAEEPPLTTAAQPALPSGGADENLGPVVQKQQTQDELVDRQARRRRRQQNAQLSGEQASTGQPAPLRDVNASNIESN